MQDVRRLPLFSASSAAHLPGPRRWWHRATEVFLVLALIGGSAQMLFLQEFQIMGRCMEPNLSSGERLLGTPIQLMGGVHRGDVVVFRPPHRPDTAFIKRVIGLPGDNIEIRDSRVLVNGVPLREGYVHLRWRQTRRRYQVPGDSVFVMGDNRDNSNDSRAWGMLPVDHIQSRALVRFWPLGRLGWLG